MSNLLEIKNLVVNLKRDNAYVQAVRDVSFSLNEGETLAIVGESGCGKSILCKSIIGILPKNGYIKSGEILFEGKDLSKLSNKKMELIRGNDISMIFQDPMTALNPTFSVGKQIMESILIHEKINKRLAKEKAIKLMELVGIDNARLRFNQYPYHFSGGQRQRIVIAIALSCNPKILIADEPTTALDVTIQQEVLNLLKKIQEKTKVSIVFITHDLGVVANMADRVAVMYAGEIVEIGKVDEIFYNKQHPYTLALMESLPNLNFKDEDLKTISGLPPDLANPPKGDAFAIRNENPLNIDFKRNPPIFNLSETHRIKTWLLHPKAKKVKAILGIDKDKVLNNE